MKLVLVTLVLTSSLLWSQAVKDPGHPSRHASVGKRSGGSSVSTPAPKTESLSAQLAKIESQGAHVPSSAAASHPAPKATLPKAPANQNRNKPMKFNPKGQPSRSGRTH